MINKSNELKNILVKENNLIFASKKDKFKSYIIKSEPYYLWKYTFFMRKAEFYRNTNKKIRYLFSVRKKNKYGQKLSIYTGNNNFGEGVRFWHGGIFVNGTAKIGKNCQLHGDNCIGNKGDFNLAAPIIGDNVDIGVGAKIIGPVKIADSIKIGAGAVVVDSFLDPGVVIAGVPARKIK